MSLAFLMVHAPYSSFRSRVGTNLIKPSSSYSLSKKSIQSESQSKNITSTFKIFYNDVYEVPLPKHHRFPMKKYRQVRQSLQSLVNSSTVQNIHCDFSVSPLATVEELETTHASRYIQNFLEGNLTKDEIRNVGFPWSPQGVKRALSSTGGTIAAARAVCDSLLQKNTTWAAHVAGGTHHAFYDYGEGFCVFSDIAVASNVILNEYPQLLPNGILILDLDVHQGNGNAKLFQHDARVITFSMHCRTNYFSPKQASDVDIELPPLCDDSTYLATLHYWLKVLEQNQHKYDFVFFQAGVDILEQDRLGNMNITLEGVSKRNFMVFQFIKRINKGFVITMGGGYPKDKNDWSPILNAHTNVYWEAFQFLMKHMG